MSSRLRILCALALALSGIPGRAEELFDFEVLQFRAKALAAQPYKETKSRVPDWLRQLSYDEYRDIRFDPRLSWWRADDLPFQLQFFHPGGNFNQPIQISEVFGKVAHPIGFSPKFYDYGKVKRGWRVPSDLGFAGFRVLHQLNKPGQWDEVVSFLGASYFRALGKDQHYGLSARGLAINTGEPGGEEFPEFEAFWVERPSPEGANLTIFALLNGPSVTGAFRFILTPGDDTVMRVRAALYCRQNPRVLGVAPLTSMFAHGENTGWARDDFRPEVHDSDGLLLETAAGEWLWRPLDNPKVMRVVGFQGAAPRGFGLMQRDREFGHYDDLEAYYHQRPSAWVEPVGKWAPGSLRLMELPTANEFGDNIVACWVPAQLPPAGEPILFEYNLHWLSDPGARPPAGYVVSTRTASVPGQPELRRFVIEFAGPYLNAQPEDPDIEAVLTLAPTVRQAGGTVVQKNRFTGAWRVVFEVRSAPSGTPVELRCFLRKGQHVLTETWSYLWNP